MSLIIIIFMKICPHIDNNKDLLGKSFFERLYQVVPLSLVSIRSLAVVTCLSGSLE